MYAQDTRAGSRLPYIALISVAILLWLWWPAPFTAPGVSPWRPQPMLSKPEQPNTSANQPPADAITGDVQRLAQFDLQVDDGLYALERAALGDDTQQALAYVSGRFGSGLTERVTPLFKNSADCGLHGVAYTDVRTVQVFTCNGIARARAVAIMAHEFAHQLEQDRYGAAHLHSDLILSEGTATWAAGKYWLGGQPDFRAYVRQQRQGGVYYPLATNYSGLGIGAMNALYYEWASFVEFLIGEYGRDKFDQVYITGQGNPGSSDYAGVYGKDLTALESEWLAWLDK